MGVILGIGGIVMSMLYLLSCDIERVITMYNGEVPPNGPRIKYGFVSRAPFFEETPDYMQCKWYTADDKAQIFDIWMKSARAFLFISTILGMVGAVFLFMALCVAFTPHTFTHWMMWNYVFAAVTIPLSYLIFGSAWCSENDCKLGEGGVQAISIFLFWLCAANTVKGFPEAAPAPQDEDEDDDSLYYENEEDMWNDRADDGEEEEKEEEYDEEHYGDYRDKDEEYQPPDSGDGQMAHYDDDGNNNNDDGYPAAEGGDAVYHDDNRNEFAIDDDDEPQYLEQNLPRVGQHDDGPTIT